MFKSIPGKGGRTILALVLLVLVTLADKAGLGSDSLSPELVESVQVILAGFVGVFYRLR